MAPSKSRVIRWLFFALLAVVAVSLSSPLWLRAMGAMLEDSEQPFRADVAVVLAGDDTGARILKGAQLVKEGFAPKVLVDGPECCYGKHESEVAIDFAVARGYPRDFFIPFPMQAHSTREEARIVVRELEQMKVRRFLLVTSDYHTRRAAGVFRGLVPPGSFRVVASSGRYLDNCWWKSREGQKQVAIEWMKTIAYWVGL